MTTLEMEIAIADFFDWRQKLIVPNVSYGAGIHECDLLILSKSGYATEVEIKVSKSDLKKDMEKEHKHGMEPPKYFKDNLPEQELKTIFPDKIKYLYFALPEKICNVETINMIPEQSGIIIVKDIEDSYIDRKVQVIRKPIEKSDYQWDEQERRNLMRLAAMRIWGLKKKLIKSKNTKEVA